MFMKKEKVFFKQNCYFSIEKGEKKKKKKSKILSIWSHDWLKKLFGDEDTWPIVHLTKRYPKHAANLVNNNCPFIDWCSLAVAFVRLKVRETGHRL